MATYIKIEMDDNDKITIEASSSKYIDLLYMLVNVYEKDKRFRMLFDHFINFLKFKDKNKDTNEKFNKIIDKLL